MFSSSSSSSIIIVIIIISSSSSSNNDYYMIDCKAGACSLSRAPVVPHEPAGGSLGGGISSHAVMKYNITYYVIGFSLNR